MTASAKYVVLDEHTLCSTIEGQPGSLQILHASVLKGSHFDRLQGICAYPLAGDRLRDATRADFIDYRVQLPRDFDAAQSGAIPMDRRA